MENPYIQQYPELMSGKTVLYVHGFASSGQSGTVARLREVIPNAHVIAPDLPLHPDEAIALLQDICQKEQPHLIIGTSMGVCRASLWLCSHLCKPSPTDGRHDEESWHDRGTDFSEPPTGRSAGVYRDQGIG